MGQFGEELRRERVSRGVALETISEKTKVGGRYLTALEDNNFDVLPGGILSKGIVRGYARAVGLDETAWLDRFLAASQEQGQKQNDDGWVEFVQNVGSSRVRLGSGHRDQRLRWAGIAVLVLVLAGLGWFVWRHVNGKVMAQEMSRPAITSAAVAATSGNEAP